MKQNIKDIPLRVRITSRQEEMIQDYLEKDDITKSDLVRKSLNYYFQKVMKDGK